jgi:hypothetical protein
MEGDILLGRIEKVSHFELREPHSLLIRPQLDPAFAVFRSVENQISHGIGAR